MPRTAEDVRNNPVPGDWVGGQIVRYVTRDAVLTCTREFSREQWRFFAIDDFINFVVPYHVDEVVRLGGPGGVDIVFDGLYDYSDDVWADAHVGTALVRVALCDLTPLPDPAETRAT